VERFWHLKNCDPFAPDPARSPGSKNAPSSRFERGNDHSHPIKVIRSCSESGQNVSVTPTASTLLPSSNQVNSSARWRGVPGEREEYAETMAASDVILIPMTKCSLMSTRALARSQLISLRRRRIERRLKSLLYRTAKDRLVHLLLELAEDYGRRTNEGVLLNVKLSHQDLSSVIGSTRETVTNTISELEQEGRIIVRRRQFILRNMNQLAESIDAPLPQLKAISPA
jgi:biotin operon repressor